MSDFTPATPKAIQKSRRRPDNFSKSWWGWSALLHAALLGVLLLLPGATGAGGAGTSEAMRQASRQRQAARQQELDAVRAQVSRLQDIRDRVRETAKTPAKPGQSPSEPRRDVESTSTPSPTPLTPSQSTSTLPDSTPAPTAIRPELSRDDMTALYAKAVEAEREIEATHRAARAAEVAKNLGVTPQQVLDATEAAPPLRPQLNLDSGDDGDLQTQVEAKRQRATARREIAAMVASAQQVLSEMQGNSGAGAAGGATTGARVQLERNSAAGNSAARDIGAAPGKRTNDRSGAPTDAPPTRYTDLEDQEVAVQPPTIASEELLRVASPGRIVGAAGPGGKWMYVDSWYTIGPFPNPDRANLRRRFAPETNVDLDAVYAGKDGRPVRWQFQQASWPMVRPANDEEYSIYYAYTELRLDRARDLWVALGSDDTATLWVEDKLVWQSSDVQRPWQPGQEFQRIRFKQGINRVLFRIENGWRDVAFSMVIALDGPNAAPNSGN